MMALGYSTEHYGQADSFIVDLGKFEGPLDLLLYLIEKNRFTLHDVQIRPIIDQYLAFIEKAHRLDIGLAGEFLDMASYLIWLKSRLLLPHKDEEGCLEGADPVQELKDMLMEYELVRAAARSLGSRPMLYWDRFPRGASAQEREVTRTSLGPLLEAIAAIRNRTRKVILNVAYKRFDIQEIMRRIQSLFSGRTRLPLVEAAPGRRREDLIATLIAALEMSRLSLLRIIQKGVFSPIYLVKKPVDVPSGGGGGRPE